MGKCAADRRRQGIKLMKACRGLIVGRDGVRILHFRLVYRPHEIGVGIVCHRVGPFALEVRHGSRGFRELEGRIDLQLDRPAVHGNPDLPAVDLDQKGVAHHILHATQFLVLFDGQIRAHEQRVRLGRGGGGTGFGGKNRSYCDGDENRPKPLDGGPCCNRVDDSMGCFHKLIS